VGTLGGSECGRTGTHWALRQTLTLPDRNVSPRSDPQFESRRPLETTIDLES
jgi:hypothetical protein